MFPHRRLASGCKTRVLLASHSLMNVRRPRRMIDGVEHLQCWCKVHLGEWVPVSEFGMGTYRLARDRSIVRHCYKTYCRRGYAYLQAVRSGRIAVGTPPALQGYTDVLEIQGLARALVTSFGGYRACERATGINHQQLLRWVTANRQRRVQRAQVARLKTLLSAVEYWGTKNWVNGVNLKALEASVKQAELERLRRTGLSPQLRRVLREEVARRSRERAIRVGRLERQNGSRAPLIRP